MNTKDMVIAGMIEEGVKLVEKMVQLSAEVDRATVDKLESADLLALRLAQLNASKEVYTVSLAEMRGIAVLALEVEKARIAHKAAELAFTREQQAARAQREKEASRQKEYRKNRWE
jgi:hypothetical protein